MAEINISDLLSTSTSPTVTVLPQDPDLPAELILIPSATTGANNRADIQFNDSTQTLQGIIGVNHDTGVLTVRAETGNIVEIEGDSIAIHGLLYPATDGSNGQVIKTDGAGNLFFDTVTGGPGGAVDSVFGRTGDVVAVTNDYTSDQISNEADIIGASVTDALNRIAEILGDALIAIELRLGSPLSIATRYLLASDDTYVLPDVSTLAVGDVVWCNSPLVFTPIVETFDTGSQVIVSNLGNDSQIIMDTMEDILFLFDGTNWSIQLGGQP